MRSLKLQKRYIKHAQNAFVGLGLTQTQFADIKLQLSRSTVSNFLNGKPVLRTNFVEICKHLNLDWNKVSDLTDENELRLDDYQINNSLEKINNLNYVSHGTRISEGNYNETINGDDSNFESYNLLTQLASQSTIEVPIDIGILVTQLREQVKAGIEARCGIMRILDMSQPVGLENIYTKVNILEKISGRRRKDIAELNDNWNIENFDRFNLGKVQEKIPGKETVKKYRTLLILGKPGSGKTTFLKHLVIQCSHGLFKSELVPFFITLKEFAETKEKPNLLNYLGRYLDSQNQDILDLLLKQGKAFICLDGLDEVLAPDSKRIIQEIENLTHKYPNNQYLMTCRIAAKEYTFEKFTEVEIADFDWEQITIFATNWFQDKSIKPETFLTRLKNEKPIQELTSSPLLLTLLCLAFEESGDFPGNRAGLYKEGLDALLRKWDAKRGKQRDEVYQKLWTQRKEDLLSKLAWKTFVPGEYFFNQDKAERYISEYIRNLPGANTDEQALKVNSEAVLKSIESQHGLLVERAKKIYSFSHLTFQEYFTARNIIFVHQSSNKALEELVNHLFDKRWQEVFLLAVSMSPNADKLVLLMKNKIDCLIHNSNDFSSFLSVLNQKAYKIALYSYPSREHLTLSIIRSFYFATELNLSYSLSILINRDLTHMLIDSHDRELDYTISRFLKFVEKLNKKNNEFYKRFEKLLPPYDFYCLVKDVEETFRKILFYLKNNNSEFQTEILELAKEAPCHRRIRGKTNSFNEEYIWEIKPAWWVKNG